jgi:hypothetical protein
MITLESRGISHSKKIAYLLVRFQIIKMKGNKRNLTVKACALYGAQRFSRNFAEIDQSIPGETSKFR